ncbi:hypothetical protein AB4039_37370 [Streptomyces sp. M-16]|uniref:hypothetical protein n=1 Tax=Streptomyces sp. M-16 TaxID=3233040 RepID=UPI0022575777
MWEPSARTPLLAAALTAGGPHRADAAFDLALAALLAHAATLREEGEGGAP